VSGVPQGYWRPVAGWVERLAALAVGEFKHYFHRSNVAFDDGGHSRTGTAAGETDDDVVAPVRNAIDFKAEAQSRPWSVPPTRSTSEPVPLFRRHLHGFFARLRRDDPVHFCDSPLYGPYWSVTATGHHGRRHVAPDLLFDAAFGASR